MVRMRSADASSSPCALRSVETIVSSASRMPSSRSTRRASSEAIMPSRACGPTPPDRTRMRASSPRSASIFPRSAWAITLRHVLAWQTTRTVLATRVGQRAVVRVAGGPPRLDHLAEFRPHGIDAADGHGAATDREVVRCELARANEVTLGGLGPALARQPLREAELRARLLVLRRRQHLQRARLRGREPRGLPA